MASQGSHKVVKPEGVVYRAERLSAKATSWKTLDNGSTAPRSALCYTLAADGSEKCHYTGQWSGSHVRKHGAVYGIWKKSFTGVLFSHIDVQDVGQVLKGIERKSMGNASCG